MVNKSSIEFYTNLKRSAISKIETGIVFKEKFECPDLLEVCCEESQAMAFKKQLDKCCKKLSQDDDVYEAFKKTGRKMHTFLLFRAEQVGVVENKMCGFTVALTIALVL